MKGSVVLSLATISVLFAAAVIAAEPRAIDARTFDVAGVKTGMNLDQAKNAVAHHFGISVSELGPDSTSREHPGTGVTYPSYITYEKGGERVVAHFEPRFSKDESHQVAVSLVIYELTWTIENEKAMANAALKKYGQPSNALNSTKLEWCIDPSSNTGVGCGLSSEAKLSVSGTTVRLIDPSWQQARIEFMEKEKSVVPRF